MNLQQKKYFSIFIIIAIFFLLFFLFIFPVLRNIIENSEELAFRRQKLASIRLLGQDFENIQRNFRLYEEGLSKMNNLLMEELFIDPEIPVSFINFFREEAANLDLSLKVSPTGFYQGQDRTWDYMTFRISGVGRFVNMMRFLKRLENSRWLIETVTLTIVRQEELGVQIEEEVVLPGEYIEINLLIKVYAQS